MVATKMVLEKYSDDHDDNEKREKIEKRKKGEIHRVISEKVTGTQWDKVTIETPDYITPTEMDKFVNIEDVDEKEITAYNEDEGVIHRDITEYKK